MTPKAKPPVDDDVVPFATRGPSPVDEPEDGAWGSAEADDPAQQGRPGPVVTPVQADGRHGSAEARTPVDGARSDERAPSTPPPASVSVQRRSDQRTLALLAFFCAVALAAALTALVRGPSGVTRSVQDITPALPSIGQPATAPVTVPTPGRKPVPARVYVRTAGRRRTARRAATTAVSSQSPAVAVAYGVPAMPVGAEAAGSWPFGGECSTPGDLGC